MLLNKKVPYKIKKILPMTMLALGPVFSPACTDKDEDPIPVVQHTTTYTFDQDNMQTVLGPDGLKKIRASADSAEVGTIILKATKNWSNISLNGADASVDMGLKPAFEAAKGKGIGSGNFNVRFSPDRREFVLSKKYTNEY